MRNETQTFKRKIVFDNDPKGVTYVPFKDSIGVSKIAWIGL